MDKTTPFEALEYHCLEGKPGKIEICPTKPLITQRDLSLAYTPGVAVPVLEIEKDPDLAYQYTSKGNLVAVISNGTAILGLGDRGPLAAKPVMEGKAVLFKKFAGIDAIDIEVNACGCDELIRVVEAISPTFGGINLEDIRSPECFECEKTLQDRLDIPIFHDDQHGTAIILSAGLINALELAGKRIDQVKVVFSGAGAAGIACANQLVNLGVDIANIWLTDLHGLVYEGRREEMFPEKERFAKGERPAALAEVIHGADVFIGLSAAGVLTPEMLRTMSANPIVFALANPDPEIDYDLARLTRPDAIIGTGRSDYPNQVNNVLGFPFIFRGALDVRARRLNEAMKVAASQSLAALAREPVPPEVLKAYQLDNLAFGREYIVPKPLDRRVLLWESPAVAQAAMESGVARIALDIDAYRKQLEERLAS